MRRFLLPAAVLVLLPLAFLLIVRSVLNPEERKSPDLPN